jgi:predicted AAA+ superfamily ATPase
LRLKIFLEKEGLTKNLAIRGADRQMLLVYGLRRIGKTTIFYDLYPNLKIFICGSASITIQQKAREGLAGRRFEFLLKPLSFREFLALKGIRRLSTSGSSLSGVFSPASMITS